MRRIGGIICAAACATLAFGTPAVAAAACGAMPAPPELPQAAAADADMAAFQGATVAQEVYLSESETYRACLEASAAADAASRIADSKAAEAQARERFAAWQTAYARAHAGR